MDQVQTLLELPSAEEQAAYFHQITAGRSLEVRLDSGDGKGKGVFACKSFAAKSLLFTEPPLVAIQHSANRRQVWACSNCYRFLGSVEQQLARLLLAAREDAAASASSDDSDETASDRGPELDMGDATIQALASGALRLPCSGTISPSPLVRCRGGCAEDWYCSDVCEAAAWQGYHQLLCTGAVAGDEAAASSSSGDCSKGKRPVVESADAPAENVAIARQRAAALEEFNDFADSTNDVFRLAAKAVAMTLLAAERELAADALAGSSSGSSGEAAAAAADPARCWEALRRAWLPFAVGHKGLWWECTAAPAEAAEDMRTLAEDALQLLVPALPATLLCRYPSLLSVQVWGSLIGMFEMNNLAVYVASPLQRWMAALEALPNEERKEAVAEVEPYLKALPDELPGCEGNAFYALHSCINHSCKPNALAWKREEDVDGSAVILALHNIGPTEEVTISYVDEEAGLEERHAELADYGFVCSCAKCAAEAGQ